VVRRFSGVALGLGLALAQGGAGAQSDAPALEPLPEPPAIPEPVESGEILEPDVRIVRGERRTITEYRVNGVLRAIKVEPDNAPPYYLVDADGDGNLETRTRGLGPDFLIPQWVLFTW